MYSLFLAAAALAAPAQAQSIQAQSVQAQSVQAQSVQAYPAPVQSPEAAAISAQTAPETAAANADAARQDAARQASIDAVNAARAAENETQYAADMGAWLAARRVAAADQAHYRRQQRAYADAMSAWRIRVADCKRGVSRACKAPTPDPAAFY